MRELGAARPDQPVEAIGIQRSHERAEGGHERAVGEAGLAEWQAVTLEDDRVGCPNPIEELLDQP